ncbi:large ribosomal subunit protein mL49-like [Ruditapes philippinarum]|uniref:large ribosomal subunit protein mL49-like n=1 Tax=Ruditapes philippinarum TaxID=129788 RepID=UPI00295BDF94|nr:large ribosomal subunit protein mL49-like [Ruditapes philippinarum]
MPSEFNMAASMVRNLNRFGRKLIQIERHSAVIAQKRCINDREIIDKVASYLPEEESKVSEHAEYPDVEISYDDFKFVKRLIPPTTVPPPPEHEVYPTPSGWVPPNMNIQPSEYKVRRTRNHMLPCYYRKHFSGRETIKVKSIYGDIWAFKEDAMKYFKDQGLRCEIRVHEIGQFVQFRGNCHETVSKFLLSKGF